MALLWLFVALPLLAQHHPLLVQGSKHIAAKNWSEAISALGELTKEEPKNQVAWFQLGDAYYGAEQYRKAINAYATSEELGFFSYIIRYPLARAHALLGEHDQAIDSLHQAIQAGFGDVESLKTHADLDGLRTDHRFAEVVLAADKVANPCKYDPQYQAFDFWVGTWNVFSKQGYPVGRSEVRKELGGCAVIEDWHSIWANTDAKNYTFFDSNKGTWHQTFMGQRAGYLGLTGTAQHGKVILQGPGRNTAGDPVLVRLTFEPLPEKQGAQQVIDHSTDDGATWTNIGILSYFPKKPPVKTASKP